MKTAQLRDVARLNYGFAFDSKQFNSEGRGLPLVRIRDVVPGRSDTYYSGEYTDRYLVNDGDYLIGMDGQFNLARWQGGKALLNQRVCRIGELDASLDRAYLARFLPLALKTIEDATPFVTVKHLSAKALNAIHVPLPPLPEQRRIAAILDHADALRAKRRQVLSHVAALKQSIFYDIFGGEVWPTAPLADVVRTGTLVTYGIVQAGPEFEGGVPYIRTGDIIDGNISVAGLRHTDPAIATRFERSTVRAGDIVMSIRATVGTTAVVPAELDGANLTQGTARIAPSDRAIGPFLLECLRSPVTQHWILGQIKGATFREITLGRLRELEVPLPPIKLQLEFVARADSVAAQIEARGRAKAFNDELFASLQARAFRGEL
ncbi:restriction endonuclease subunit S [Propionibacteriaceae bacterium Y1685]